MTCPHCGGKIVDQALKVKQARHAKGWCVECKAPLSDQEKQRGHWRCWTCRVHVTVLRRRMRQHRTQQARRAPHATR